MTDGYFSFNSQILPAPSIAQNPTSVVQLVDPVMYQLANFFTQLLNVNLQPRFTNEALVCGLTHANIDNWVDNICVAQTTDFPLDTLTLKGNDFKFPMLNIVEERAYPDQLTLTNTAIVRDYCISWVLPPMSPRQYNRMYHFLQEAAKVFIAFGQQGYDPKVNPNGPSAWKTAGLSFGSLNSVDYDHFDGLDKTETMPVDFPSMQFRMSFWEKNQLPVLQNFSNKFSEVILTENLIDGYNPANPINNFIDGYIFPNISLASCYPTSGSINGNTLITIIGTGFLQSKFPSTSQLLICGVPVIQIKVLSPTVIQAVTNPGVFGSSGQVGNIVLTDQYGNTVTLIDAYTYI